MNNTKKSSKTNISFIVLLVGVFMAALDNGIISAALTTINSSFDVSATAGTWGITLIFNKKFKNDDLKENNQNSDYK